jgi:hypothetical protein
MLRVMATVKLFDNVIRQQITLRRITLVLDMRVLDMRVLIAQLSCSLQQLRSLTSYVDQLDLQLSPTRCLPQARVRVVMAMPVQFNTMVNVYWRARLWQTSVCVHA